MSSFSEVVLGLAAPVGAVAGKCVQEGRSMIGGELNTHIHEHRKGSHFFLFGGGARQATICFLSGMGKYMEITFLKTPCG